MFDGVWGSVLAEGGGHRATKININMGLWGAAGQDSRADPLIGVTDRSNNKPYSVLPRSGCPPGSTTWGLGALSL